MRSERAEAFIGRWRRLQEQQADVDFAKATLARDIRAEFGAGEAGDRLFVDWCGLQLGLTPPQAEGLLVRARTALDVDSVTRWRALGGHRCLRLTANLSDQDRQAVVSQATTEHRTVIAVMRDRGLLPQDRRPNVRRDVQTLAEYVSSLPDIPRHIRAVVSRYVKRRKTA